MANFQIKSPMFHFEIFQPLTVVVNEVLEMPCFFTKTNNFKKNKSLIANNTIVLVNAHGTLC